MIKFKETVSYVETWTLTGRKLIVGDRSNNVSFLIKKSEQEIFKELVEVIDTRNYKDIEGMPLKYQSLSLALCKKGFFTNSPPYKGSFNEYRNISSELFKKEFDSTSIDENNNILKNILYYILFLVFAVLAVKNVTTNHLSIDIENIYVSDVLITSILLPILVVGIHELGHYLSAWYIGIPVSSIIFCFVVIYPSVYLTYSGLDLCKTSNKIVVISGGIFAHLTAILVGLYFLDRGYDYFFLKIWLLSNISMIYANALPLTASDGYFILTSVLGIFNLRLRGYRAMNYLLHNRKTKKSDMMCGVLLVALWGASFLGMYNFWISTGSAFGIGISIIHLIYALSSVILIFRFVLKIYKMEFKN